jgi:hypothetical protein
MRARNVVTIVLLAFVGASVAYLIFDESSSGPAVPSASERQETTSQESEGPGASETSAGPPGQQTGHKLVAYYFHRTQRCQTCLTIEAYAQEALAEAFPQALETGRLEWRAVNVEDPANEHFIEDYQITSSSLVLVDTRDGVPEEWRTLQRVWELVGDELKFKVYVEAEAMVFLE